MEINVDTIRILIFDCFQVLSERCKTTSK